MEGDGGCYRNRTLFRCGTGRKWKIKQIFEIGS